MTIVDVVLEFTGTGEDDPNNRASTRVLRMLRLFRVVRLGKLTRFASFLRDKFESEALRFASSCCLEGGLHSVLLDALGHRAPFLLPEFL